MRSMSDKDNLRRAADDLKRYRLHNETGIPDFGLVASEYLSASRGVRRAITVGIIALIMFIPAVAIVLALLR